MEPIPELLLTAMTYNVRVDAGPREPSQAWTVRRPLVTAVIGRAAPDVFGLQEAMAGQVRDVAADLPDCNWVGTGRDGGDQGEHMALFYRAGRFDVLESGDFWLSDTPERVSATWGNRYRRMVTWARLLDRRAKRQCVVLNTHFDHEVEEAREKSAGLVRQFAARWPVEMPVVLLGDFNAEAGRSGAHRLLTADGFFRDAWDVAGRHVGDAARNTFNDFRPAVSAGSRIDWILVRGALAVESIEIGGPEPDGTLASDHFPVIAKLRYST